MDTEAARADGESRGGGDTCATASVIAALPFQNTGDSCGFTDDYDEVCGETQSSAQDLVYAYTPAADITVDISLCSSSYDTFAYVYEDDCPGTLVACNDDACGSDGIRSELIGVDLFAGHTYYIIVDGFASLCGDFILTVTEGESLPDCPPDAQFSQPVHGPADDSSGGMSDEGWSRIIYENFSGMSDAVCEVQWWGLEYTQSGDNCTKDPNTFEIKFYADAEGEPGAEECSYVVTPGRVDTGLTYTIFQLNLLEYSAELAPCCALTDGWISIRGVGDLDCRAWWMSSGTGDGASCSGGSSGIECGPPDFDLALCLTGANLAGLVTSTPADDASLWRTVNTFIALTFDADISEPGDNDLRIEVMEADGLHGTSYTTSTSTNGSPDLLLMVNTNAQSEPRVLEIHEIGAVCSNGTWIAVRNAGDWAGVAEFEVHYQVQTGDVDDEGNVLFADISTIIPGLGQPASNEDRRDMDGDNDIGLTDISAVVPFLGNPPIAKPSGHDP